MVGQVGWRRGDIVSRGFFSFHHPKDDIGTWGWEPIFDKDVGLACRGKQFKMGSTITTTMLV